MQCYRHVYNAVLHAVLCASLQCSVVAQAESSARVLELQNQLGALEQLVQSCSDEMKQLGVSYELQLTDSQESHTAQLTASRDEVARLSTQLEQVQAAFTAAQTDAQQQTEGLAGATTAQLQR